MQGRKRAGLKNGPAQPGVSKQPPHEAAGEIVAFVYELAIICEGFCEAGPDPRRVDLRDLRAKMRSTFGLYANESDIAQELAELDGEEIQDAP